MAYRLTFTEGDLVTIAFVGGRYAWSEALLALDVGETELAEHEAWTIKDAFESDTEGGHQPFPMLDPASHLHEKLMQFWQSIV
jgi:hypothetical protein